MIINNYMLTIVTFVNEDQLLSSRPSKTGS